MAEANFYSVASHASSHQNGGSDELNLAGLSGFLADEQDAGWLRGYEVQDAAPSDGDVLIWNDAQSRWEPSALSALPDPYTPADGTWNIIGKISAQPSGGGGDQFGLYASATGTDSAAINGTASGVESFAGAKGAVASGDYSSALGRNSDASGEGAVCVGEGDIQGDYAVGIGHTVEIAAVANYGVGIGRSVTITGLYGIAGGFGSTAGEQCISWGQNSSATGLNSGSYGVSADCSGDYSLALMTNCDVSGENSFGLGRDIVCTHDRAGVIGYGGISTGNNRITIGQVDASSSLYRQTLDVSGDIFCHGDAENGQYLKISMEETEITLSGSSTTASNLIPAGALGLAFTARVTQAITGSCTGWSLGDSGDPDRWAFNRPKALNTVSYPEHYTDTSVQIHRTGERDVIATAEGGVFTGGKLRIVVFYVFGFYPAN